MKHQLIRGISRISQRISRFFLQINIFFRLFNYIYEHSPYQVIKYIIRLVEVPDKEYKWAIYLRNGKKIITPIHKGNLKSRQFAFSYKWHSPDLAFTEHLLNTHFDKSVPWIDVGANMGIRSMMALSEGKCVYFIEPNSELNKLNIERCRLNGFTNYTLYEVGASDKSGTVEFVIDRTSYNSSIEPNTIDSVNVDRKEVIRIDSLDNIFCDNIKDFKAAFIKIDVEGHELHVLEGAKELLSRISPTMVVEVDKKGNHFIGFEAFLRNYDYEIFEIGVFKNHKYYKWISPDKPTDNSPIITKDYLATKDMSLIAKLEQYSI